MIRKNIKYSSVKQNGNIKNWKNRFLGVPVFILGNGPSLNDIDPNILENCFTIGINRSFKKVESTILMWQDLELWFTERYNLIHLNSYKVCSANADPQNRFLHFKIQHGNYFLPTDTTVLYGKGSTIPLAVQFAYILGCDPIILLGADCKERDGITDFYGNNSFHNPRTMHQCVNGLQWIKEEVSKHRKVISCGDNDIFEKSNFIDVYNNINSIYKQRKEYWFQFLI